MIYCSNITKTYFILCEYRALFKNKMFRNLLCLLDLVKIASS